MRKLITIFLFTIVIACTSRQEKSADTNISMDTLAINRIDSIINHDSLKTSTNNNDIKGTIYDNEGYDDVKEIINSLKSGNLKIIRNICTDAGYKDLLKVIPTHQQKEKIFKQIGNDLSIAIFHRGVVEEMITYYYFEIEDRGINLGILPLKDGHKLIVFKYQKSKQIQSE